MAAVEPLCLLMGVKPEDFSQLENSFIEAELLTRIYCELKEIFRKHYRDYFQLLKFNYEMENAMLEDNFMTLVINDILSTEEYTLDGIANYVGTHEDVVSEVVAGRNASPSIDLFRKIIELHRNVRVEVYRDMMKKIAFISTINSDHVS